MIVTRDRRHLKDRDQHLLRFLRERGPSTAIEIATNNSISLPHARDLLRRLRAAGAIKATQRGAGTAGRLPTLYEAV